MRDRLYRSREERVLFGVAGGVAEWLDIDPALVRIVFALLIFAGGIGFFLYLVMAVVVPEEPAYGGTPPGPGGVAGPYATGTAATGGPVGAEPGGPGSPAAEPGQPWIDPRAARRAARQARRAEGDGRGVVIFGAILIVIGAWFLVRRYVPALDGDLIGPIVLIVIGGLLLAGALGRSSGGQPPGQA